MHILIVNQYYWPEDYGSGVEVRELAEKLHREGHKVIAVTGLPNYPYGRVFPGYRWPPFRVEELGGVRILRCWFYTCPRTSSSIKRGFSALSFGVMSSLLGILAGKPQIVLGYTPPIFMGLSAWLLARLFGAPFVLNVKDLFTASILAGGLAKPGILTKLLQHLETFLYRRADRIITNATTFENILVGMGINKQKINMVPDWADGEFINPTSPGSEIRNEWGLRDKFIVLYSGNMGYSSDLETVLEAALCCQDIPDMAFVLAGEGVRLNYLKEIARKKSIDNVYFQDLQPRERYPYALAAADLALVTLSPRGGQVSTQGKLYSIMAAGKPVIAVVSQENDIYRVVVGNDCGWWVKPGDYSSLAQLLHVLYSRPAMVKERGTNARNLFEEKYSLDVCYRQFVKVFHAMVDKNGES